MKRLLCLLLWLVATNAPAQPTGQSFYQRYKAVLTQRFGQVATEAELQSLLKHIIDRNHLEVDHNHYFRPATAPLAYLVAGQRAGANISRIKATLVYPLLRFVLPLVTPRPAVTERSALGERMAAQSYRYLGVPYGAPAYNRRTGQGTLDCSGLVRYVFEDVGASWRGGNSVADLVNSPDFRPVTGAPQAGDLLVRKHRNGKWSHVGIYVGGQQLVEAPYSGTVVRTTPYKPQKWQRVLRYVGR
ncbi:hypothetical protein DYU11_15510 [Fibrisoma montanum]|uniref:NlpC/P60 domain-containing protein n=1 Tax=Fibrisoma montanum TaxID=2305895 RepID=A0A418M8J9_9BACT|nr:NlpC/P60 family protein [Fibrisoma montanum]RIV22421.1 hypothetical protein DYU11_15510 [Fibrisoma montanum]